jgi:aminoglycoside phosphotransferase (APT) family kinase protein
MTWPVRSVHWRPRPVSSRLETAVVLRERLEEHSATRAWRKLRPNGVPSEIRVLKERSKGIRKSAVYWLGKAAPGEASVIAKYSRRTSAKAEALVYEEFLGPLGVPVPAYFGMLDEGGPFCWLFMQYVPGRRYSPANSQHRRLAGGWLARLHHDATSLAGADRLPDRGVAHHVRMLDAGRGAITDHYANPSLSPAETLVLQRLSALLGEVRRSWSKLEEICSELPQTLVHGDLVRKNLHIAAAGNGARMVAFDWENAGWGPPAIDLAQSLLSERFAANACLDTYRSARAAAPTPTRDDIERQATAGTVLRCLTAIYWTSQSLGPSSREWGDGARQDFLGKRLAILSRLEVYLAGLEHSWRRLDAGTRV